MGGTREGREGGIHAREGDGVRANLRAREEWSERSCSSSEVFARFNRTVFIGHVGASNGRSVYYFCGRSSQRAC